MAGKHEKRITVNRKRNNQPATAQQTIPLQKMFADGTARSRNNYYSRTIQFFDINYQLQQYDDRYGIMLEWQSFLNFFDSSVSFEFIFLNKPSDVRQFRDRLEIEKKSDGFDEIRAEFSRMLESQAANSNSGFDKTKYLTFGVEASGMSEAHPKLESIETDLLENFSRMGITAYRLESEDRLRLLYEITHIGDMDSDKFQEKFDKYKSCENTGNALFSARDVVAPDSFDFSSKNSFKSGKLNCAVNRLAITASELDEDSLKSFLDMESSLVVSIHIKPIDSNAAIKSVKRYITEIDTSKINEQKKAVRSGYDMEIIPTDIVTFGNDARKLLDALQSNNERLFKVTFLIMNTGRNALELSNNVLQTTGRANQKNCDLAALEWMQEDDFVSILSLAENRIKPERELTGISTAVFVPFITQELFQNSPEAVYYGVNTLSGKLIMADRKTLKNPNGLILGTPGSGKSFSAKREIANAFLVTDDDIIVCDPEAEYAALVHRLDGEVVKISAASTQYINPMDINMDYSDDEDPLYLKSDFILAMCELVMNSRDGIEPIERSVIDRCLRIVYGRYFENPVAENMPVLGDLYEALMLQEEPQAKRVADCLEIYVKGSLNVFNHQTNVNVKNRLVCYDIKDLGKQLKKIGMLIIQDQVWGRVTANRNAGRSTRFYVDEFHLLLREPQTSAYSIEIWKRFRKWGGVPSGITQNVKDLLASREIENIFENSDFILMLNQAAGDREMLSERLGISAEEIKKITQSGEGEGLLFFGNMVIPFTDHFPKDTELYRIMTTKLSEVRQS